MSERAVFQDSLTLVWLVLKAVGRFITWVLSMSSLSLILQLTLLYLAGFLFKLPQCHLTTTYIRTGMCTFAEVA